MNLRPFLALLALLPLAACSAAPDRLEEGDTLDQSPEADTVSASGPVANPGGATEVWSVTNAWTDRDTVEGKKAGVAWGASSGLTWEQKYAAWVNSFKKIPSSGWGDTVEITTPFGTRTMPGPALECAEVAMFLRITFSSWYHLPFYLTGWDSKAGRSMFAGNFGFVYSDGSVAKGFPSFRAQYKDYEKSWKDGQAWPSDASLRKMHLGGDDANEFLKGEGAGAYFDEMFLNKRVGYFARLTLLYFGSINLADPINLFQIKPEATSAGDVLLERWQKKGIGHTIPVIHVDQTGGEHLAVTVASGSMPRRQPKWDGPDQSQWSFTNPMTGGKGEASDGTPYAKLGGGIHRWRTPVLRGGRWSNEVPTVDKLVYIVSTNLDAIAARPERFAQLLAEGTPEEQRKAALDRIESARMHLREHPSSCSARTNREDAFDKLYELSTQHFSMDKAAVDKQYRTLEDHVFGELVYDKSKTCCWNSTTKTMADLVMAYAKDEQAKATQQSKCVQPTVFRASGGGDGYDRFRAYAKSVGHEADWKTWSEDEPCAQRAVHEDTLDRTAQLCR
jgi:hypothetical protein